MLRTDDQKPKVNFISPTMIVVMVIHSDITWGIPLQAYEKKKWKEIQSVK